MLNLAPEERRDLLAQLMRERYGPVGVIRDPDDDEPYSGSLSPAHSTEAWRLELLDRWAA